VYSHAFREKGHASFTWWLVARCPRQKKARRSLQNSDIQLHDNDLITQVSSARCQTGSPPACRASQPVREETGHSNDRSVTAGVGCTVHCLPACLPACLPCLLRACQSWGVGDDIEARKRREETDRFVCYVNAIQVIATTAYPYNAASGPNSKEQATSE
jgi:hypothetical protein